MVYSLFKSRVRDNSGLLFARNVELPPHWVEECWILSVKDAPILSRFFETAEIKVSSKLDEELACLNLWLANSTSHPGLQWS